MQLTGGKLSATCDEKWIGFCGAGEIRKVWLLFNHILVIVTR